MSQPPKAFAIAPEAKIETPIHRFGHGAMNAVFEVLVCGGDAEYARQAAGAAFEEVDRLEETLSRYLSTSDVSQINALGAGRAVRVGLPVLECLKTAAQVWADTGGAFDVTVGALVDCWRNPDKSPRTPSDEELADARRRTGMNLLEVHEDKFAVAVKADGVTVDLGGIGKGYAVDQVAAVLREWGIASALVHGGTSSILAVGTPPGHPGWPVSVRDPGPAGGSLAMVRLKDRSLSGSAQTPGRPHVIDPRQGRPAAGNLAAYVAADSATLTDCLSTAFLVMSAEEVKAYCEKHPQVSAMLAVKYAGDSSGRKVVRFGEWQ